MNSKLRARLKDLREILKSGNEKMKIDAVLALSNIGKPAIPLLINTLADETYGAHSTAREVLERMGKLAVPALIRGLKNQNAQVRQGTVIVLRDLKDKTALEPLIASLKEDDDCTIRSLAAQALGGIGGSKAIVALIPALKDSDMQVRGDAAWALGKLKTKRAVLPLIALLSDITPHNYAHYTHQSAAKALGEIGDMRAYKPLLKVIRDEASKAHIFSVRAEAVKSLYLIGGVRAIKPLIKALEDSDSEVVRKAIDALSSLGDSRAIMPLTRLMKNKNGNIRSSALHALAHLGAVAELASALKDENPEIQNDVAYALGLTNSKAVEPLIAVLNDSGSRDELKSYAATSLGKLKDSRAVMPLIQALKADNHSALEALASIGLPAFGPLCRLCVAEPRFYEPVSNILKTIQNEWRGKQTETGIVNRSEKPADMRLMPTFMARGMMRAPVL